MQTIKKLSPTESQKIAAGEVVERPANIVKELLENSLDADATRIVVTARAGGKDFLSICDNGKGMSKEDLLLCFHRHTTSKITSVNQLEHLTTFGFRGEALASICSVAHVTITSKEQDAVQGTKLILENGVLIKTEPVGTSVGTTVTVEHLFASLPARQKFLKATTTEWNHILTLFKAYALNNIHVHFIMEHDGEIVFNCPPTKTMVERVGQLFDTLLASNTIQLTPTINSSIQLSGALTTHPYARYDRNTLYLFVNGRWIKNYQIANAVIKGYLNSLPQGRYPAAFISLFIDPTTVDINVHPKKEEVRFLHPLKIAAAVTSTVKQTLEDHLSQQLHETKKSSFLPENNQFFFPSSSLETTLAPVYQTSINTASSLLQEEKISSTTPFQTSSFFTASDFTLIGQYNKTYLLLEHQTGLYIIDQHAAHERILYERFQERFPITPGTAETIALLFPLFIPLSPEEVCIALPYLFLFEEYGISIEQFSKTDFVIKTLPLFLKDVSLKEIIHEMVVWIREDEGIEGNELFKKLTEKLRAQMACKAAVKAGDTLAPEQMQQLLHDLETTRNRFTCPHGRPTSWLLPLYELEKKFKRKF